MCALAGLFVYCVALPSLAATVLFRFQNQYGSRIHTALAYAMNSEFCHVLSAQMV